MGDADSEFWWWSDPAGTLKTVEGAELRNGLKSARIPARSLVWKVGWADWYHASTVPELADAVPVLARRPRVEPAIDPDKLEPPPPPLDKFEAYDKPARIGSRRSSIPPPRVAAAPARPAAGPALPKLVARASGMPRATPPVPGLRAGAPGSRPQSTPPPPVRGAGPPRTTPPPPPVRGPRTAPPPPPQRAKSTPAPSAKELVQPIVNVTAGAAKEPGLPEIDVEPVFDEEAPTLDRAPGFGGDEADTLRRDAPAAVPPPPELVAPPPELVAPPEVAVPAPDAGVAPDVVILASASTAEIPALDAAPTAPMPAPTPPPAVPSSDPPPPFRGAGAGPRGAAPPLRDRLPPPGPERTRLFVVGGVVGFSVLVLLVAGISHLFSGKEEEPPAASATARPRATAPSSAATAAPAPSATHAAPAPAKTATAPFAGGACTIARPATKLARSVAPGVPLYLSNVPGSTRLAVGFASSARDAVGVTIDPATLGVKKAYHHAGKNPVLGVVPLTTGGKLAFAADRDGSPLEFAHTIDGTPPFIVGLVDGGFAQAIGYGEPTLVWPGSGKERITEPRVATAEGTGHAVAFRRGGRSGEIRVGWLTVDGKKDSDLGMVNADGPRVGTPSVAAGDGEIFVTFAARATDDAPWAVRVAHAKVGAVPKQSSVFAVPPGGPGGDAISPAAAAQGGGRWVLQWTEGSVGGHVVRVQTLDSALAGVGDAVTVSPPGQDAGQGAIWASGHSAVALYLIKDGDDYALWGTALSCP